MLKAYFDKAKIEAGCDEAGRGCLAGPVVAAAVILPKDYQHDVLNDSKQLTEPQRIDLQKEIKTCAISYGIGVVSPAEIDEINILNASFLAMNRAIDQLKRIPELLLIDGNRYKAHTDTPYECIIKGDCKYYSIAAASVLAKTYRDDFMRKMSLKFPDYGWDTNVGYPTNKHRDGIRAHGATPQHRMTFRLLPSQLELFVK
jgi:ribonuclease HII